MADIILDRVEINSFMGIDKSRPVLLDLGKYAKKGKTVTTLSGDQEVGKTSTMMAIMYLLGVTFDIDFDNLINRNDKTINLEQEFTTSDGAKYRVKATKSKFVLERDVDGKWYNEDEPKTTLKKIVGNLGVSPMFLKGLDGDKQIEWFQKTFSADDRTVKREKKLKADLATVKTTRRESNREYDKLKKSLQLNELWQNAEDNYKRFEQPVTIESAEAKFNEASKAMEEYNKAKAGLDTIQQNIVDNDNFIRDLESQLEAARNKQVQLLDRKKTGEAWLAENATVSLDYNQAKEAYMNVSREVTEYNLWQSVLQQKKDMDEYETLVQQADGKKDEIMQELLELSKKYLPKIKDLKIKVAKGLDDDEEEEGIYYKGKTLAQLSESELWALFFQIWEQKEVRFVFIENVSSLGNNAVSTLNELAQKGIKVFATMMDRKKQTMKIAITDKVD